VDEYRQYRYYCASFFGRADLTKIHGGVLTGFF
jgi:hypothetical protein